VINLSKLAETEQKRENKAGIATSNSETGECQQDASLGVYPPGSPIYDRKRGNGDVRKLAQQ